MLKKIDGPADILVKEVDDFNAAVESGEADSFGRVSHEGKFTTPPFYDYPRQTLNNEKLNV